MVSSVHATFVLGIQHARDTGNAPGLPVMLLVYENGMAVRDEIGALEFILHPDNRSSSPPCPGAGYGCSMMKCRISPGHSISGWFRMNLRTAELLQRDGSLYGRACGRMRDLGIFVDLWLPPMLFQCLSRLGERFGIQLDQAPGAGLQFC